MTKVWKNLPIDNHFWAFYCYLKRTGDNVMLLREYNKVVGLVIDDRS